jgi:putative transposase
MARPLRIEYPGAFYHVMNRGQSRRNIFMGARGQQSFLDLLADIARLWKVEIYAYCLMDNHYLCGAPHNTCYVKLRIM